MGLFWDYHSYVYHEVIYYICKFIKKNIKKNGNLEILSAGRILSSKPSRCGVCGNLIHCNSNSFLRRYLYFHLLNTN